MKLLKLIPGAAIALTVLIPLKANAENLPNGWSQVGQSCMNYDFTKFIKLQKNSDKSLYGVYGEDIDGADGWKKKDITLQEANQKMNNICDTNYYQPTS